jgi:hypothetical protein
MNKMLVVPILTASICGSTAFGQTATYNFIGKVSSSTGIYSSVPSGATVTGTYTINIGAAIPSQTDGTIGSASFWEAQSNSASGTLGPSPIVFSSTAEVAGVSYSTSPPTTYGDLSLIEGNTNYTGLGQEDVTQSSGAYTTSNLFLHTSTPTAFLSSGLINLAVVETGYSTGLFGYEPAGGGAQSDVNFNITSLTLASETLSSTASTDGPIPLWALGILGAGLVGVASRRLRKTA